MEHGRHNAGGNDEAAKVPDSWKSAVQVRPPTETDYLPCAHEGYMTEDQERQLRILAWHASNAAYRKPSKKSAPRDRERRNMERLLNRNFLFEAALMARGARARAGALGRPSEISR